MMILSLLVKIKNPITFFFVSYNSINLIVDLITIFFKYSINAILFVIVQPNRTLFMIGLSVAQHMIVNDPLFFGRCEEYTKLRNINLERLESNEIRKRIYELIENSDKEI